MATRKTPKFVQNIVKVNDRLSRGTVQPSTGRSAKVSGAGVEKAAQKLFMKTMPGLFDRNPTASAYRLAGGLIEPGRTGKFSPAVSSLTLSHLAKTKDVAQKMAGRTVRQVGGGSGHHSDDQPRDEQGRWV